MSDLLLFDLPKLLKVQKHEIIIRCKTCNHFERREYGGATFFYCGTRKSKRTQNGKLKIMANREACPLHQIYLLTNTPEI